jgi:type I site-specific restriction-modification system R (restriction) subunit
VSLRLRVDDRPRPRMWPCGLLAPETLLDVIRNFTVFERDDKTGKTIRKLCRYQQYGAVNKAVARARNAKSPPSAAAWSGTPRARARA